MIGVAISTRNRRETLERALYNWKLHNPQGIGWKLIVVDDASATSVPDMPGVQVIHNPYRMGVAMTKNRCIEALIDAGCDDMFLADDDVWPIADGWWTPYVNSPEPHLSYQWVGRARRTRWAKEHDDGQHWSITFPRGVLLYVHRKAIDAVGGMDPAHGAWGGEHVEWANRINLAGLTSWKFADVCGSDKLWYSVDKEEGNTINSTLPLSHRQRLARSNGVQWDKQRPSLFVHYRQGEGVQDYSLGPSLVVNPGEAARLDPLRHVMSLQPAGTALEFGVGAGTSLKTIASRMPVIGFDSFEGLPEKWRDGFDAGMFACPPPNVRNSKLKVGLFSETLPDFDWPEHVGLVHIDCDLYSSTKTVLEYLEPHLKPGCYIVFDEYHGYEGHEEHEMRAWREFADKTGIKWTVIGHGIEQWAIRIT